MRLSAFVLFFGLLGACSSPQAPKLSAEHQRALASFQVMEGFRVELVAAEPLVQDPVAMEVDERGRLYVVEMPGYPLDLSRSGRIKLLKDTNGDGYPDKSVIFADSLTLPNGIMRWKKGVIVTDAPNVWYLEDTDGDDRADVRRKLLTGFARSNPQHNLNSPILGLDNWIYLAHEGAVTPFVYRNEFGDQGGPVGFPDRPDGPVLPRNANGRNVRFRPDTYELEALSGKSQFGHTFDAWGHHLLTANANHLFQEVLPARYLSRNPYLLVPDATQDLPDHGDAAEVHPITENPAHQLLTDRGVITSSCGVTWYLGGAYGDRFRNVTFIAEPSHNLVHADLIQDHGASFVASRLLEKQEFLASKDSWFRPVNFYVGPDGALYVVDYYRQHIEHPEWMSEEMAKSGMLYNGHDKGRIYRIVPTKRSLPPDWLGHLTLDKLDSEELVELLKHENNWYRRTAQRLLYERRPKEAIDPLRQLVDRSDRPEPKVHALWLLETLGATSELTLRTALRDPEPGVRENAIRIAERHLAKATRPALLEALLSLRNDPSAKVRYQLLCTLGEVSTPGSEAVRMAILQRDIDDKWPALAALTAASGREMALYRRAARAFSDRPSEAKKEFFAYLGATIANRGQVAEVCQLLAEQPAVGKDWYQTATLSGIARLWAHKGVTVSLPAADRLALLPDLERSDSPSLQEARLKLLRQVGLPKLTSQQRTQLQVRARQAAELARDQRNDASLRAVAVQWLALYNPRAFTGLLERLSLHEEQEDLRLAAFRSMSEASGSLACSFALREWPRLTPGLRRTAVDVFLHNPGEIRALLAAIDRRKVPVSDLAWPQRVRLMNYHDTGIRTYARQVLAVGENRQVVVQQYVPVLQQKGNAVQGKEVFRQVCSGCHQLNGQDGQAFGPDLASIRNRNATNLLTEILHPNHSIADGYDQYTLTLKSGKTLSGIIAQETASTLTLRQAGGNGQTIARSDVVRQEKATVSAMPEGLESSLNQEQMRDLLAYLRGE